MFSGTYTGNKISAYRKYRQPKKRLKIKGDK